MEMNLQIWKQDTLAALKRNQSSSKPDTEKVAGLKRVLETIEYCLESGEQTLVLNGNIDRILNLY